MFRRKLCLFIHIVDNVFCFEYLNITAFGIIDSSIKILFIVLQHNKAIFYIFLELKVHFFTLEAKVLSLYIYIIILFFQKVIRNSFLRIPHFILCLNKSKTGHNLNWQGTHSYYILVFSPICHFPLKVLQRNPNGKWKRNVKRNYHELIWLQRTLKKHRSKYVLLPFQLYA